MPTAVEVRDALDLAHREEWGRVLASTARLLGGDLGLAEEATQEAFVAALATWPQRGIPTRPGAWLTATARRKALDAVRRDTTLRRKLPLLAADERTRDTVDADVSDAMFPDDRLRLVFTCCHPALAPESRAALTLRLVCGLTTAQIAHAFLVPEATMAARITRAKKKIAATSIPYRIPSGDDLDERTDDVLSVVHVLFTAGHTSTEGGPLVSPVLVERSLDLARVLATLLPDDPEVLGLLALLELTDARRDARLDADGELVVLADQDRTRWDAEELAHGLAMLDRALALTSLDRPSGRFLLQAALAAVHAEAASWDDTDWPSAVLLYERLLAVWPSPVVALNRAVAVGYAVGPHAGLVELEAVARDPALARFHYVAATRGELLARLGRRDEARRALEAAVVDCPSPTERRHLQRRIAELSDPATGASGSATTVTQRPRRQTPAG